MVEQIHLERAVEADVDAVRAECNVG